MFVPGAIYPHHVVDSTNPWQGARIEFLFRSNRNSGAATIGEHQGAMPRSSRCNAREIACVGISSAHKHAQHKMWDCSHLISKGARRSVSRVLSRPKAGMAIHLGRSSPNASRDRPERRRGRPARRRRDADAACRSYLVLLPVGFSLPPPLPAARCALTAPFHPCRPCHPTNGLASARRYVFCGTFPGVAPAGRYPAPYLRGARTFLPAPKPCGRVQSGHPTVWHRIMWDAAPALSKAPLSGSRAPDQRDEAARRFRAFAAPIGEV